MKRKPIKIDWDELEDAFTNPEEGVVFFLDRVTGRVVLEGEGEEDDLDADDESFDPKRPAAAVPPRNDPTRVYVPAQDNRRKLEWMKEFVSRNEKDHPEVIARLVSALSTEDPPAALSEVLNAATEVRDEWYLYRSTRLRSTIDDWLKSNDITTTAPPPWK